MVWKGARSLTNVKHTEAHPLLHSYASLCHSRACCKLRQQAGRQNPKGWASSTPSLGWEVLATSLVDVARCLTSATGKERFLLTHNLILLSFGQVGSTTPLWQHKRGVTIGHLPSRSFCLIQSEDPAHRTVLPTFRECPPPLEMLSKPSPEVRTWGSERRPQMKSPCF